MSLDYSLITDSSLPDEVKSSSHYISVDKKQWIDLIEYSEDLVDSDRVFWAVNVTLFTQFFSLVFARRLSLILPPLSLLHSSNFPHNLNYYPNILRFNLPVFSSSCLAAWRSPD